MKIFFSTFEYEMNHGAKPRGKGSWAFIDAVHARKMNYLDFVYWSPFGTYSEAKKMAAAHFKKVPGFSGEIEVCS